MFNEDGIMYFDSVVGTDSHTTMVNSLGVAGWGVGGIEAVVAMLGQVNLKLILAFTHLSVQQHIYHVGIVGWFNPLTKKTVLAPLMGFQLTYMSLSYIQPMGMVLPGVVGFKLTGKLQDGVTTTDLVLTMTEMLRKHGAIGKFVEFYGKHNRAACYKIFDIIYYLYIYLNCFLFSLLYSGVGVGELSLPARATIANMSPEYGATMGFFPVDQVTLDYLKLTGRSNETVRFSIRTLLHISSL